MIEVEGLTINYDKTPVLWDVSFSLPKGILCGIAGPNGAGKSTLLKALLGLIRPLSGRISLAGRPLSKFRKNVAYVPQHESVDWDFPITAFDVVLMGRYNRLGLFGRPRKADLESTAYALEQVGMSAYADRQISQLSGGQQQRLFIARALVQEADYLLLDEPFSAVDLGTEKTIVELLQKQRAEGKTVLIVFHDLIHAEEYFDWLLLLNRRLVACGPVSETFTPLSLQRTFGNNPKLFEEATSCAAKTLSGL